MEYRMFVVVDMKNSTLDGLKKIEDGIEMNAMAQVFNFNARLPENDMNSLGAMVRAILWVKEISFSMIVNHQAAVLVQERDVQNSTEFVKVWKNIGSWDCAGINVGHGR